jgi:DNA-binding transcriptional LysR family regulator
MIKLDAVETFIAAAEQGSLSAAARVLGLSRSVVSERLAELEAALGARLIQRTTRRMALTEDGLAFLPRARRIVGEVADAAAELAERRGELAGPLRLSGPVSFGYLHLGPALYPFLLRHPGIALTLDLDDRFVDVQADGYDAVIRHGPIHDRWLVAARVASSQRMLVASPGYLAAHGTPRGVAELRAHRAILYANRSTDWRFAGPQGDVTVHPRQALRVNSGLVMRGAAVAGLGLALLPSFMVHAEIGAGRLRVVDIGLEPEHAEIHLAYPKGQHPSAKLRALITHLRQAFGSPPYWDVPSNNAA